MRTTEQLVKFIKSDLVKAGAGLAAAGASLALPAWYYARHIEPYWLEVTRLNVNVAELEGISPAWKGFKVAFMSDLHIRRRSRPHPVIRAAVQRILEEKPDLVALGGDIFNSGIWGMHTDEVLMPLVKAGLLVAGVMGNHDYFGRRDEWKRLLRGFEESGVKMLVNDVYPLEYNGQRAWLAGIDDMVKGEPDLDEICRRLPPGQRPLILLNHNPDFVRKFPPNVAHIILCGHNHGGQINFALPPFHRSLNWVRFAKPGSGHYSAFPLGWYTLNGNRFYVGRGLGMSGMQLRFNARPELVMLELV